MTGADVKNVGYHKAAGPKAFPSFDDRNMGRLYPVSCGHVFAHSPQGQVQLTVVVTPFFSHFVLFFH